MNTIQTLPRFRGLALPVLLSLCCVRSVFAVDISTYSFNSGMNCDGLYPLPDTGQYFCYDGVRNTPGSCSTTTPAGQDGFYSRAASSMTYTVNADNTVTDNVTGLMWRRCSQGKNDDATCTGTAGTYIWENAITQCENETADGYSDWRLPNIKELYSIVKHQGSSPLINTAAFPATLTASYYWSSTSFFTTTKSLGVIFSIGDISTIDKVSSVPYVRCVRGGP